MSDFSKQPNELSLIPVDGIPEGDACDGCYYHCQQTEFCQHPDPDSAVEECSKLVETGTTELYENFVFVEVV